MSTAELQYPVMENRKDHLVKMCGDNMELIIKERVTLRIAVTVDYSVEGDVGSHLSSRHNTTRPSSLTYYLYINIKQYFTIFKI
jgi:hypothetical protein